MNKRLFVDSRKQFVSKYQSEVKAKSYREYDEQVPEHQAWVDYCSILKRLCDSFSSPINVLDIGCGTGRFFCALRGVHKLYGIDSSREMLNQAMDPLLADVVGRNIEDITLLEQPMLNINIPSGVHLIYSIGLLHEYDDTTTTTVDFYNYLDSILEDDGVALLSYHETSPDMIGCIIGQSDLAGHTMLWSELNGATLLELHPPGTRAGILR